MGERLRAKWLCALGLLALTAGLKGSVHPAPVGAAPLVVDGRGLVPPLVCPGDAGCARDFGPLRVGVGVRVITPDLETWDDLDGNGRRDAGEAFDDLDGDDVWDPVWLAGFEPGRAATGVHDEQWARALSLSRGELRLGIVVLDLLGLQHDDVVAIRVGAAAAGLDFDHVLVVSTHVHSARDTIGFAGETAFTSGHDPAYNGRLVAEAVEALEEAVQSERPASVTVARTEAPDLVSDSRLPIVIDQSLWGVRFDDEAGPVAALVVWGNHPESLGGDNTEVSSDYPHYLREAIEAAYPGATALFLPGTLGGLTNPMGAVGCPDFEGNETCPTGTFEKARYIGEGAADAVLAAWEAPVAHSDDPALRFRRLGYLGRITNLTMVLGFQLGIFERSLYTPQGQPIPRRDALRLPIEDVEAGLARVQTEVGSVTIGPITFLTVPGEVYPELWLAGEDGASLVERPANADYPDAPIDPPLVSSLPDDTLRAIINQANDSIGYIIPRAQFDLQPPHAYVPEGQYGEMVSLGAEAASELYRAVEALYALQPAPPEPDVAPGGGGCL